MVSMSGSISNFTRNWSFLVVGGWNGMFRISDWADTHIETVLLYWKYSGCHRPPHDRNPWRWVSDVVKSCCSYDNWISAPSAAVIYRDGLLLSIYLLIHCNTTPLAAFRSSDHNCGLINIIFLRPIIKLRSGETSSTSQFRQTTMSPNDYLPKQLVSRTAMCFGVARK